MLLQNFHRTGLIGFGLKLVFSYSIDIVGDLKGQLDSLAGVWYFKLALFEATFEVGDVGLKYARFF